jgi:hypothetical protein
MKRSAIAVVLLLGFGAGAGHAQQRTDTFFRSGTWMLRLNVGGAAFTDFQRATATAEENDPELGTFQRRVSARTTATAGGSLTYWVLDGWGIRGSLSWAPSGFAVWNEDRAQRVLDERQEGERESFAHLGVWFADVSALFRLPVRLGTVVPYGMAGAGVVEYRAGDRDALPPEAQDPFADGRVRSGALVLGIGAMVLLQQHDLLLNFELTGHITPTPLSDEGVGEWFEIGGVPVQLRQDPLRGTDGIGLTNNLRLTVGLTLPLR